jgi:hypothetical protein
LQIHYALALGYNLKVIYIITKCNIYFYKWQMVMEGLVFVGHLLRKSKQQFMTSEIGYTIANSLGAEGGGGGTKNRAGETKKKKIRAETSQ